MIRRIDPVGRVAYGALCVGAMATLAIPLLLVAGVAAGLFFYLADSDGLKGLLVWLLSWTSAVFAALLFLGIFLAAWPLASDWVTEWSGYATGFVIGAAGLGLMAALVFLAPVPLYAAVLAPLAATFTAGFAIAGRLGGLKAPAARPRPKVRALRRR